MKAEWFIELRRTDGGSVDAGEVARAWQDPRSWRRPMWLDWRPRVGADEVLRINRQRCRIVNQPDGLPGNSLLYAGLAPATDRQRMVYVLPYFQRLCAVGLHGRYRARVVCRLREFAYHGDIPPQCLPHTQAALGFRLGLGRSPWREACVCLPLAIGGLWVSIQGGWLIAPFALLMGYVGLRALLDAIQMSVSGEWSVLRKVRRWDYVAHPEEICWAAVAARVCYACGYDLRASDGPRCPECGHPNLRWWCEQDRLSEAADAVPNDDESNRPRRPHMRHTGPER